jgi:hypothetical protein
MKRLSVRVALTAALLGGVSAVGQARPFFQKQNTCPCNSPYNPQQSAPALVPVAASQVYGETEVQAIPTMMTDGMIVEASAVAPAAVAIHQGGAFADTGAGIPNIRLVNTRSLVLNFDVQGTGSSGVGNVELWYTRNGQQWQKYQGGNQTQSPFAIDVPEDGLYGFSAVAVSGVGMVRHRPQPGDAPQVWIEADTTKPDVRILGTQAGADETGRTLTVRWSATDKNLGPRPITLYYAGAGQTTWAPFATNLPNTGHFTWRLAPGLPAQVLVRIEATDRVGNTGADQTNMPSPVDLARPSAVITGVANNGIMQTSNP